MAEHGSPPAPDKANHPGRKVSNVASTQGRDIPSGHALPYTVTRLRRERPESSQPTRRRETSSQSDWNEFRA